METRRDFEVAQEDVPRMAAALLDKTMPSDCPDRIEGLLCVSVTVTGDRPDGRVALAAEYRG